MDAEAAASAFLGGEVTAEPRGSDASVAMIRTMRVAREAFVNQRTQTINQLARWLSPLGPCYGRR